MKLTLGESPSVNSVLSAVSEVKKSLNKNQLYDTDSIYSVEDEDSLYSSSTIELSIQIWELSNHSAITTQSKCSFSYVVRDFEWKHLHQRDGIESTHMANIKMHKNYRLTVRFTAEQWGVIQEYLEQSRIKLGKTLIKNDVVAESAALHLTQALAELSTRASSKFFNSPKHNRKK